MAWDVRFHPQGWRITVGNKLIMHTGILALHTFCLLLRAQLRACLTSSFQRRFDEFSALFRQRALSGNQEKTWNMKKSRDKMRFFFAAIEK